MIIKTIINCLFFFFKEKLPRIVSTFNSSHEIRAFIINVKMICHETSREQKGKEVFYTYSDV